MRNVLFALVTVFAAGCAPSNMVIKAAEAGGLDDVEVTASETTAVMALDCSADDTVAHKIRGVRHGKIERRVVCCGPERAGGCELLAD